MRIKVILAFIPLLSFEGRGFLMKAKNRQYGNSFWKAATVLFLLLTLNPSFITSSYAEAPKRIISLSPSTTEILYAAGLGDNIVGVTTFCDYPEDAKKKPKIGGMSNPSLEAVVSSKPDIVVMTTDGNPKEFEDRLRKLGIKTHVFRALRVSELPGGIRDIGIALDEKGRFDALALDIENKMKTSTNVHEAGKKKMLYIVWPEPLIVAGTGTAADDAINLIGGINIAGDVEGRYPKFSIEEIMRQSPDIIFIGEGRGMEDVSQGLLKRLSSIPAVREHKVYYVSDSLYRLGPRVIDGIEELRSHLEK